MPLMQMTISESQVMYDTVDCEVGYNGGGVN